MTNTSSEQTHQLHPPSFTSSHEEDTNLETPSRSDEPETDRESGDDVGKTKRLHQPTTNQIQTRNR